MFLLSFWQLLSLPVLLKEQGSLTVTFKDKNGGELANAFVYLRNAANQRPWRSILTPADPYSSDLLLLMERLPREYPEGKSHTDNAANPLEEHQDH